VIVPTGTGPLARVCIYAGDWTTPVEPLVAQVADALDRVRPVGVALDVDGAVAMPVTIALDITADPDWSLAAIASSIENTLDAQLVGPGRFGFATTLYRSEVITWTAPLAGVIDTTITQFRFTEDAADAATRDELVPPFGHIIRIDNDPSAAEMGSVSFRLRADRS
jgi:Baseplate J-like protein